MELKYDLNTVHKAFGAGIFHAKNQFEDLHSYISFIFPKLIRCLLRSINEKLYILDRDEISIRDYLENNNVFYDAHCQTSEHDEDLKEELSLIYGLLEQMKEIEKLCL